MKKILGFLIITISLFNAHNLCAFSLKPTQDFFIGIPLASYEYREPSFMKDKGYFYGIMASIAHYDPFMLKAEAVYARAKVDYKSKSTGVEHGNHDYRIELRTLAGLPIALQNQARLIPYLGFGLRFFEDDSTGRVTNTGAWGYNRESNYLYLPIGIEWWKNLNGTWQSRLTIEYDQLWHGFQESDLSMGGLFDITNKQNHGHGFKGQLKIIYANHSRNYFIEPYFHYWNINRSKPAIDGVTFNPDVIFTGVEPHNITREVGMVFGLLV